MCKKDKRTKKKKGRSGTGHLTVLPIFTPSIRR
jgi:hypothetical protein